MIPDSDSFFTSTIFFATFVVVFYIVDQLKWDTKYGWIVYWVLVVVLKTNQIKI